MVERPAHNRLVPGSNPGGPTAEIMRELDTLYELQCLDLELRAKEQRLESLSLQDQEIDEAQKARGEYESTENELKALRLDMKDRELELESLSEKIKKIDRELLSGKGGVKELMDKQAELEALRNQKKKLEDVLIELMERMEALHNSLSEEKRNWEAKEREKRCLKAELEKERAGLEKAVSALGKRREELVALLPSGLITVYEQLRAHKTGRAVAAVRNGRCGGCQIVIAHRHLVELRKRESLQSCENCGRILYWGEESS